MGILDSAGEMALLERAIIEIVDLTGRSGDARRQQEVNASGGTGGGAISGASALGGAQAMQAAAAAKVSANSGINGIDAKLNAAKQIYNPNTDKIKGAVRRQFKVQFNPSTLSITSFGGGKAQQMNYSNDSNKGLSYNETSTHIELSVQLIFDEMDLLEAFHADSLGSLAKNAITKGISAAGAAILKRPSVQETVEGFLGAMRRAETRNVTFAWGKMVYSGIVNGISSKYTLFNPSGKPVRATVQFRMICADAKVAPGMMGYWQERYDMLFNKNISMKGMSNNLINFNK